MIGTIAAVVLLGAALGVGVMVMKNRSQKPQDPPHPSPQPRSAEDEFKDILDVLLGLNLMMRLDPELEPDIVQKVETIIDDLKSVLPAMMEKYPGEALTYELKKIGLTHLKKIVREFLDLSLTGRKAQLSIFQNSIQSLHEVTQRSRQIIENNETAEFKTMAHFLAGKFS